MRSITLIAAALLACASRAEGNRFLDGSFSPFPACNAKYNTPCSVTNVFRMVKQTIDALQASNDIQVFYEDVSSGKHDVVDGFGFSPMVFHLESDNQTLTCVSKGKDSVFGVVGENITYTLDQTVNTMQKNAMKDVLYAAKKSDGWFSLLLPGADGPEKYIGYIAEATSDPNTFVAGLFRDVQLPILSYCMTGKSTRCAIRNTRSVVGNALAMLMMARTEDTYRWIINDLTYNPVWLINGHYPFVIAVKDVIYSHPFVKRVTPEVSTAGFSVTNLFEMVKLDKLMNGSRVNELFSISALNGGGWANYEWRTSLDVPAYEKVSFVMGYDRWGEKTYVGLGFNHLCENYVGNVHCQTCLSTYALPCSISNVEALVGFASVELLTDVEEAQVFHDLTNDPSFKMDDGFSVFVFDFNGTCVVDGATSSNVGKQFSQIFDASIANTLHQEFVTLANAGGAWMRYESDGVEKAVLISKISKFGKAFYMGSQFHLSQPAIDSFCDPLFAEPCAKDTVISIVGQLASNILVEKDKEKRFQALDANSNPGFDPLVLSLEGTVLFSQRQGASERLLSLNAYLTEYLHAISLPNELFGSVKTVATKHGGGWLEMVWTDVDGVEHTRELFAMSVEFDDAFSSDIAEPLIVLASFEKTPPPPRCPSCPADSFCDSLTNRCVCGSYFSPLFYNQTSDDCAETVTYEMVCRPNPDKDSIKSLKKICIAMLSINVIFALFSCVWAVYHRKDPIVRASQVEFLVLVSIGTIVSSSSILFFTIDDEVGAKAGPLGENARANFACMAQVWAYCIGFVLTFSTLFVKLWRVYTIFSMGLKKSNKKLSRKELFKMILGLVLVDILLVVWWTVSDPLVYVHEEGFSGGSCRSESSGRFLALIGVYHTALLLVGNIVSYRSRNISTVFSESKYLSIAMVSNLQIFALAIPVLVLVSSDAKSNMFLRSGVVFLNDFSVQMLIFGPKMYFSVFGIQEESSSALGSNLVRKLKGSATQRSGSKVGPTTSTNQTSSVNKSSTGQS